MQYHASARSLDKGTQHEGNMRQLKRKKLKLGMHMAHTHTHKNNVVHMGTICQCSI